MSSTATNIWMLEKHIIGRNIQAMACSALLGLGEHFFFVRQNAQQQLYQEQVLPNHQLVSPHALRSQPVKVQSLWGFSALPASTKVDAYKASRCVLKRVCPSSPGQEVGPWIRTHYIVNPAYLEIPPITPTSMLTS